MVPVPTVAEKTESILKEVAKLEDPIAKSKANKNFFQKFVDFTSGLTQIIYKTKSSSSSKIPDANPANATALPNNVVAAAASAGTSTNTSNEAVLPEQKSNVEQSESEEMTDSDDDSAEIELSLCGHRINSNDQEDITSVFTEGKVSYEEYSKDPLSILENKNLLIRFEDKLYEWRAAAPLILSLLAYKKPLPHEVMQLLTTGKKPHKREERKRTRIMSKSQSPHLEPRKKPAPHSNPGSPVTRPSPLRVMVGDFSLDQDVITEPAKSKAEPIQNLIHTKEPTSDQLKELPLCDGPNDIEFIVANKESVRAKLYFWDWKTKIVISDIDGTITRSDALGQLMPIIGRDWSQRGVVSLYRNIEKNGYKIIYLSARPIGMADFTRWYFDNLHQDGLPLPKGPLIVSPDRFAASFEREVISRKPQVYFLICNIRD